MFTHEANTTNLRDQLLAARNPLKGHRNAQHTGAIGGKARAQKASLNALRSMMPSNGPAVMHGQVAAPQPQSAEGGDSGPVSRYASPTGYRVSPGHVARQGLLMAAKSPTVAPTSARVLLEQSAERNRQKHLASTNNPAWQKAMATRLQSEVTPDGFITPNFERFTELAGKYRMHGNDGGPVSGMVQPRTLQQLVALDRRNARKQEARQLQTARAQQRAHERSSAGQMSQAYDASILRAVMGDPRLAVGHSLGMAGVQQRHQGSLLDFAVGMGGVRQRRKAANAQNQVAEAKASDAKREADRRFGLDQQKFGADRIDADRNFGLSEQQFNAGRVDADRTFNVDTNRLNNQQRQAWQKLQNDWTVSQARARKVEAEVQRLRQQMQIEAQRFNLGRKD